MLQKDRQGPAFSVILPIFFPDFAGYTLSPPLQQSLFTLVINDVDNTQNFAT